MKRLLITLMIVIVGLAMIGCGKEKTESSDNAQDINNKGDDDKKTEKKADIKIEDIDWSVTEGEIDGQHMLIFSYTNNTNYTITDVEIKFKQREDVTAEQRSIFDDLKEKHDYTDEDVQEVYILGYNRKFADPGETVSDSPCVINGTYVLAENMGHYELMEPDNIMIAYLENDEMYAVEYNFTTKEYSDVKKSDKDMHQWSDSDICLLLPKADSRAVKVNSDNDDKFTATVYDTSEDNYKEYVEACKQKGFDNIDSEKDNNFKATNADGYKVRISYTVAEESMSIRIEKP